LTAVEATDTSPRVTISLVTYNGSRWMPGCIESVVAQTFADFEVLVLDNASSDDTVELVEAAGDPRIRIERSADNLGYAAGHNRNIAAARGEFVVLLNQDVELHPAFLAEAVDAFTGQPGLAAAQGRVLRLAGPGERVATVDSTGLEMNRDRRVVSRGQGMPDGDRFASAAPVFGADGPVPVYRAAALRDAQVPSSRGAWEVLDEDFFMYKEDVDLAWRLRRLGWTAWYAPSAIAWHARTSGGPRAVTMLEIARTNLSVPAWIRRVSWRNQRLMQLKNDDANEYLRDLPWIARREILSWALILVRDPRRAGAIVELVRALRPTFRKRRYLARRFRARRAAPLSMHSDPRDHLTPMSAAPEPRT
jgi:GT2 family glycosyltransferase